jgi:hypothetical protein
MASLALLKLFCSSGGKVHPAKIDTSQKKYKKNDTLVARPTKFGSKSYIDKHDFERSGEYPELLDKRRMSEQNELRKGKVTEKMLEGKLIKCGNCTTFNYASSNFCLFCGEKLEKKCPNCERVITEEYALYCSSCGTELHKDSV